MTSPSADRPPASPEEIKSFTEEDTAALADHREEWEYTVGPKGSEQTFGWLPAPGADYARKVAGVTGRMRHRTVTPWVEVDPDA